MCCAVSRIYSKQCWVHSKWLSEMPTMSKGNVSFLHLWKGSLKNG